MRSADGNILDIFNGAGEIQTQVIAQRCDNKR